MIGRGHLDPAKLPGHLSDARVVGGDDDFAQRPRLLALLDDPLDERPAGNERERFAREARGSVTGRDDAEDDHLIRCAQIKPVRPIVWPGPKSTPPPLPNPLPPLPLR